MKDNVLYVNFSFEHRKRRIKDILMKLFGIRKHKKLTADSRQMKRTGLSSYKGIL